MTKEIFGVHPDACVGENFPPQRRLNVQHEEEKMFELFTVHTIVPKFGGSKDVKLNWFVHDRNSPWCPPYAELIAGSVSDPDRAYAEAFIDELFTAGEASQLLDFLNKYYNGSHYIRSYPLPINNWVIGFSALSIGGPTGFYDLWDKNMVWNLEFKVSGYYDLRNYEPLPDRESGLLRQRIFESCEAVYVINGQETRVHVTSQILRR
jgi:hypothetical protein